MGVELPTDDRSKSVVEDLLVLERLPERIIADNRRTIPYRPRRKLVPAIRRLRTRRLGILLLGHGVVPLQTEEDRLVVGREALVARLQHQGAKLQLVLSMMFE